MRRRRTRSLVKSATQSDVQKPKLRVQTLGTPQKLGSLSPTYNRRQNRRSTRKYNDRSYPPRGLSVLKVGSAPSSCTQPIHSPIRPLTPTFADIRQRAVAKSKSASKATKKKSILTSETRRSEASGDTKRPDTSKRRPDTKRSPDTKRPDSKRSSETKNPPRSKTASKATKKKIPLSSEPRRSESSSDPKRTRPPTSGDANTAAAAATGAVAADADDAFFCSRERVCYHEACMERRSSARQYSPSSNLLFADPRNLLPTPKKTGLGPLLGKRRSEIAHLASIRTQRRHSDPSRFSTPLTPLTIEDFTLIGSVGHGAFGKVLLAHLKGSKRNYVAIKGISKRLVVRKMDILTQEVANLKRSQAHPFILTLYAVIQDTEFVYIVTEYVPGGTLEHLLQHFQRWNKTKLHKGATNKKGFTPAVPIKLVCFYTAQITQALGFLHEHDILYNDLKLENVLVQMDGYCKLIDLGLSYRIESKDDLLPLCGTPANMAPEVVRTGAATGTRVNGFDKAADWWALGVLMFHLYFGVHPFDWGDGMKASFIRILKGDVQFPSTFVSTKSSSDHGKTAFRDLVKHLLCVDREKRIGSGKLGTKNVKSHSFFKELLPNNNGSSHMNLDGMWVHLEKKLIRTPFLPREHRADCNDKTFALRKRQSRRHSYDTGSKDASVSPKDRKNTLEKVEAAARVAALPELTQKQQTEFFSQLEYYVNESWFRA